MILDWPKLETLIEMEISESDRRAIEGAADWCAFYTREERAGSIPMPAEIKKRSDAIAKQAQKLRDLLCADDPASQYAAEAVRGWAINLDIHQLAERAHTFSDRIAQEIEEHSGPANTLRTQSRKTLVRVICRVWLCNGGNEKDAQINAWWKTNVHPKPGTLGKLALLIKEITGGYGITVSDQQIYDDAREAIAEVHRDFPLHS
jgi:hypothetical protein